MIHIELDAEDLAKLIKAGKKFSPAEALDKVENISFTPEGNLSFKQKFFLETQVETSLATDGSGALLIDIKKFSGSFFLNMPLMIFRSKISSVIAASSSGVLEKTGDSQLKLDLNKFLPFELGIEKISIADQMLAMDIILK